MKKIFFDFKGMVLANAAIISGFFSFIIFTGSVSDNPVANDNPWGIVAAILLAAISYFLGSRKSASKYINKNYSNEA